MAQLGISPLLDGGRWHRLTHRNIWLREGCIRYVRNPMYVGVLCTLAGEALLFRSVTLLYYAGGTFAVVHLFVVLYEEPTLRRQFGESYDEYRRHVRRWWPRLPRESAK